VDALTPRRRGHGRREIDANDHVANVAQCVADETGPAAEIERASKMKGTIAGGTDVAQRLAQQLWSPIAKTVNNCSDEISGVLNEQTSHVACLHGFGELADAEARKLQRSAVAVTRIGGERRPKSLHGAGAIAALCADVTQRKPSRGEIGRAL